MVEAGDPVSIRSAPHYTWGGQCDGWQLLQHAALSVIQERVPPGAGEVAHFHSHARQFFYVLDGAVTLEVQGRALRLAAGEGCEIPPRAEHRLVNHGVRDASFLVISAPTTAGDRTNTGTGAAHADQA